MQEEVNYQNHKYNSNDQRFNHIINGCKQEIIYTHHLKEFHSFR